MINYKYYALSGKTNNLDTCVLILDTKIKEDD